MLVSLLLIDAVGDRKAFVVPIEARVVGVDLIRNVRQSLEQGVQHARAYGRAHVEDANKAEVIKLRGEAHSREMCHFGDTCFQNRHLHSDVSVA